MHRPLGGDALRAISTARIRLLHGGTDFGRSRIPGPPLWSGQSLCLRHLAAWLVSPYGAKEFANDNLSAKEFANDNLSFLFWLLIRNTMSHRKSDHSWTPMAPKLPEDPSRAGAWKKTIFVPFLPQPSFKRRLRENGDKNQRRRNPLHDDALSRTSYHHTLHDLSLTVTKDLLRRSGKSNAEGTDNRTPRPRAPDAPPQRNERDKQTD